jgi:hypothetical protein
MARGGLLGFGEGPFLLFFFFEVHLVLHSSLFLRTFPCLSQNFVFEVSGVERGKRKGFTYSPSFRTLYTRAIRLQSASFTFILSIRIQWKGLFFGVPTPSLFLTPYKLSSHCPTLQALAGKSNPEFRDWVWKFGGVEVLRLVKQKYWNENRLRWRL